MRPERGGPHRRHGAGRGGRRMRRGDIRTAVLLVLDEEPRHGYDVIQALEEKSDGAWRPSPGSIYPTLALLEDEGLARSTERDGKRVYELTETGRVEAAERLEEAGDPPWAGTNPMNLRAAVMQLHAAARQVGGAGTQEQVERATAIVNDARKGLYRLLAED